MEDDEDSPTGPVMSGAIMTEADQKQRRNSIKDILADDALTPLEKRRSIQSLMDGRRRSSTATNSTDGTDFGIAQAAAEAATFYSSDTDHDDDPMDEGNQYGYGDAQQNGASDENSNDRDGVGMMAQRRRKERSTSLPGWSEHGFQAVAPLAAASTNTATGVWDDPMNVSRRMEKSRPDCSHYERNCTIVSPCCGLAFGCRICHDDCPVLPMPFAKRVVCTPVTGTPAPPPPPRVNWADTDGPRRKEERRRSLPLGFEEEETHHEIDRFAIAEIICRLCYTRQSSKT